MVTTQVTLKNKGHLMQQIESYRTGATQSLDGLEMIDWGWNRTVYEIIDDTYGSAATGMVIKIQDADSPENKQEAMAWDKYKTTRYAKYLVPVAAYATSYEWLVMPYGESVPEDHVDEELHDILYGDLAGTDISHDDFVYMDGNYANQRCCDYASIDSSL